MTKQCRSLIKNFSAAAKQLKAGRLNIILDFDGTLTRIRKHADEPRVSKERLGLLRKLSKLKNVNVIILSGRPLSFLKQRVPVNRILLIAERGIYLAGSFKRRKKQIRNSLLKAKKVLSPLPKQYPGSSIELKPTSLVFHFRNVKNSQKKQVQNEVYSLAKDAVAKEKVLEIVPGRMIIEFLPRGMPDKGDTIRQIMKRYGGASIYIGDDTTDEPAFREVKRSGFGILVRSKEKTPETHAVFFINGIEELTGALRRIYKFRSSMLS